MNKRLHNNVLGLAAFLSSVMAVICFGLNVHAQGGSADRRVLTGYGPSSEWEIGLGPGLVTPLKNDGFFSSVRPTGQLYIHKSLTPAFGLGVETALGFNTSLFNYAYRSSTMVDHSYVGLYSTIDMLNLIKGYPANGFRRFSFAPTIGAGWLHAFTNGPEDINMLATKFGVDFKYLLSDRLSLRVSPAVMWQLAGGRKSTNVFNVNRSAFSLQASIGYRFGGTFRYVRTYDPAQVENLNRQINDLRSDLAATSTQVETWKRKASDLEVKLDAANKKQPTVVKEVSDNLNTTRYIFFGVGSSRITADQQPNVEMLATYMRNHPESMLEIKGYASPEGSAEVNSRLAIKRASAVKDALTTKYKISARRISARGVENDRLFQEPSWNRVSVCTLRTAK